MNDQRQKQEQEAPGEICTICWQSHAIEQCPLQGKECTVFSFGAKKEGREPISQREAQDYYKYLRGKLKKSTTPVLIHQLYQHGHWYVAVIWQKEDALEPVIKELGLALWLSQIDIPLVALPEDVLKELCNCFVRGERTGVLNLDNYPSISEATQRAKAELARATRKQVPISEQGKMHILLSREWKVK